MANFNKRYFGLVVLSLILFTGIFLIKEKCFAYSQNFDSYSNGDKVNTITPFASSTDTCLISNAKYASSSPNSIISSYSSDYCWYNENDIKKLSVNVYNLHQPITYNKERIIFFSDWLGYNSDHILSFIELQNNWLGFHNGITFSFTTTIPEDTWINVKLLSYIDKVELYINNVIVYTLATTTHQIISAEMYMSGDNYGQHTYFDDFNTDTTLSYNAINLTNPEDASIQNKNIFYWAYNFTISSTSYAAYDSFDTQIEYIPPIAGATSTFIESNWYKPAVQPDNAYIIIYDQGYNIPLYLGNYTAGAYLIGLKNNSFDILASDFVNFTMSEGTTTAQTAWCSGLCNDLATTTSSWWPPLVCAGRYAICYAMYPHDLTKQMFWQAYSDFKLVFPFNIFFEITSTIDNVFASTTMASTTGSFGLPMIRKVGTTSQYYILPLLTSTTTANFLGNSNANLLRFSLSSIIYAFYTVGIILILW
jgi:hypothetical protein